MSSFRIRHQAMATLLATPFLVLPALVPGAIAADCGPFPEHRLWGNLNAEKVAAYVHRKFKGDWRPYVRHLEKQVKSIEGIRDAGKSARLRIGGETVTLTGSSLDDYAEASARRLTVVRCLASRPAALKSKPVRGAGRPDSGSGYLFAGFHCQIKDLEESGGRNDGEFYRQVAVASKAKARSYQDGLTKSPSWPVGDFEAAILKDAFWPFLRRMRRELTTWSSVPMR